MPTKLHLGSVLVDWIGETFTPADAEALKSRKREEALVVCPALRGLSSSRFEMECSILDGVIKLDYCLVASAVVAENELFHYYAGRPITVERIFEDEAHRVFSDLQKVRTSLSIATSPTISRADLRSEEPSASERRQLRLAAKQFSGSLLELPGIDRPTEFVVDKVPLYLPSGATARISASVKSMSRAEALLTKIELLAHSQELGDGYYLPEHMRMRRKFHADFAQFGPMLLHAQDHRLRVTLDVLILFDWATAAELMLDLVCLVTHPEN
jgi:hypothetical protein